MTRSRYLDWLGADDPPLSIARAEGAFSPDLVLGFATGYGPYEVAPFVRSLRAHTDAAIALFVDRTPALDAFLAPLGVHRISPPPQKGWSPHLLIGRFKHYLAAVEALSPRRVLLSDVRDVAFQGDPFASGFPDDGAPLALFAETSPGVGLAAQGANRRWLNQLVGEAFARRFFDRPCVCGGTVLGDRDALLRAVRIVLALCAIQRSGALAGIGADQAALNLIAHWGLADAFVAPNYGRAATIGYTEPPRVASDGALLNPDGSQSPILHQYDRHADAKAAILAKWAADLAPSPPQRARRPRWRTSLEKRRIDLR